MEDDSYLVACLLVGAAARVFRFGGGQAFSDFQLAVCAGATPGTRLQFVLVILEISINAFYFPPKAVFLANADVGKFVRGLALQTGL